VSEIAGFVATEHLFFLTSFTVAENTQELSPQLRSPAERYAQFCPKNAEYWAVYLT